VDWSGGELDQETLQSATGAISAPGGTGTIELTRKLRSSGH
jgi:hypothetical protein